MRVTAANAGHFGFLSSKGLAAMRCSLLHEGRRWELRSSADVQPDREDRVFIATRCRHSAGI
jgi:hypothetical protein